MTRRIIDIAGEPLALSLCGARLSMRTEDGQHVDVPIAEIESVLVSHPRATFSVQSLAELATRREVHLWRGSPVAVLQGTPLAATFAPVPGWRSRAARLDVVALHPWPWLRRPATGSVASYSAWRKAHT